MPYKKAWQFSRKSQRHVKKAFVPCKKPRRHAKMPPICWRTSPPCQESAMRKASALRKIPWHYAQKAPAPCEKPFHDTRQLFHHAKDARHVKKIPLPCQENTTLYVPPVVSCNIFHHFILFSKEHIYCTISMPI